jgi:hypothetical protein
MIHVGDVVVYYLVEFGLAHGLTHVGDVVVYYLVEFGLAHGLHSAT